MFVRRSGFTTDRPQKPGDAITSLKLPLPRAQTRGDRRCRGLHSSGMENAAKLTKNLSAQRTLTPVYMTRTRVDCFHSIP